MATGTRLMQEISDQFLHCKICFENFREPKTLSCLHTFCSECLQQQYESELSSRSSRFAVYSRSVTCPLCRKKTDLPAGGVRRLPENHLVCNLTNVLAKKTVTSVLPCEICHSVRGKVVEACSKCLDCNKTLCKSCVDMHTSTKVTQQHSLIDLEGEKNIECKIHPEENIRFYCEPCECCICVVCTFQEHKDHDVCSLSDGFSKHKCSLDGILDRSKSRMEQIATRLQSIKGFEMAVTGVRESIRDLAISYIAQIRSRERELLKTMDETYGEKLQELKENKPILEENMDELQNACNLTDIMLRDKGVELLLLKKELESKMTHLLDLSLPEVPDKQDYEVSFIPGEIVLGKLNFSNSDLNIEDDDCILKEKNKENELKTRKSSIDPDLISNCTQTDTCCVHETSTSMLGDMKVTLSDTNSQTDLTNTAIEELLLLKQNENDKAENSQGKTKNNENTPPPDLLPANSFSYTPGRWIRSRKIQTDICNLDFTREMSDREFVHALLVVDSYHDPSKAQAAQQAREKNSNESERPMRRMSNASTMTTQEMRNGLHIGTETKETRKRKNGCKDVGVNAVCEFNAMDTQTPIKMFKDSTSLTETRSMDDKSTSMPSTKLADKETTTPRINCEDRSTYTDLVCTSDRATSTVGPKVEHRAMGTVPMNTSHAAIQVIPQSQYASTNTPSVNTQDRDIQTVTEVVDRGTVPDVDIEMSFTRRSISESSVDSAAIINVDKSAPKTRPTCDRASDAYKTPVSSKATETVKVKTTSTSSETVTPKFVDRDTATTAVKTLDCWTETVSPQLVSTGVTPPRPATIEVGVATVVIDTNDEATCTEVKSYRSVQSETTLVVCDNETLTDHPSFADAQTSVEISVETAETETDPIETEASSSSTNTDPSDLLDDYNTDSLVTQESQGNQCDVPIVHSRETNTSRRRRKSKESQTEFVGCQMCEQRTVDDKHLSPKSYENKDDSSADKMKKEEALENFNIKVPPETQEVGTMAISCVTCQYNHQETAVQTQSPIQLDKASATSFDFDQDFLERALSRDCQDAATSTESLPYIGLLSEIDVDELIVIPEAAFELVSDDNESDAGTGSSPEMVDSETCTDYLQYVETGTQTASTATTVVDEGTDASAVVAKQPETPNATTSKESTLEKCRNGKLCVGEIIKSMVASEGDGSTVFNESGSSSKSTSFSVDSSAACKHLVGIGVNTDPKVTFEKETCTPMRHLFSKGTMTFFVTKMDKSTSTLAPSKVLEGPKVSNSNRGIMKTKSVDKITMTARAEHKDIGVVTEKADIDGRIEDCISKLRNVSERLNSPTSRKPVDAPMFDKDIGASNISKTVPTDPPSIVNDTLPVTNDKQVVSQQTNKAESTSNIDPPPSSTKSNDRSPARKPQPITTLKGRKPPKAKTSKGNPAAEDFENASKDGESYDSKSLPRQFVLHRPRPVKMGSQPLNSGRLPLLRYNSAPEQMTTVPPHMISTKPHGRKSPKTASSSPPPRASPSKIPITKKLSPPEKSMSKKGSDPTNVQPIKKPCAPDDIWIRKTSSPTKTVIPINPDEDVQQSTRPKLRRALPSITETRTPSTCSDTSMNSFASANSMSSSVVNSSIASSTKTPLHPKTPHPSVDTLKTDDAKSSTMTPSTSTTMSSSWIASNSESMTDSVFKKSSNETIHSVGSTDALEETSTPSTNSQKKSGMGFMQRFLSKRKKNPPEPKKEQQAVARTNKSRSSAGGAVSKALAAAPLVPQAPLPESQAHGANLQLPPHSYTPQVAPKSPTAPKKSRPFVYVRQRIFSIQQDNVEDAGEKKAKKEGETSKKVPESAPISRPCKEKAVTTSDKEKPSSSHASAEKEKVKTKSKDSKGAKSKKADSAKQKHDCSQGKATKKK